MSTPADTLQTAELTSAVAALLGIRDAIEAAADRLVQAMGQSAAGAD